jgi:uncharacterized protein YdaU (DUF1376 family)
MLLSLIEHYWRTACKSVPTRDDELFAVVRAHRSTWKAHKADILAVFEAIRPELERYHADRTNKRGILRIAAHNGGGARTAQAARARLQANAPPPAPITDHHQLGIVPKREPSPPRPPKPDARPPRPIRTDTITRR